MPKLNDLEVDDALFGATQVEPLALQEEFVRWSGDYAYWNQKFADASRLAASTKLTREQCHSRLTMEIYAKAEAEVEAAAAAPLDPAKKTVKKAKLPTVNEVEARVICTDEYSTAKAAETDAAIEAERINGVLQMLRGKKDMLMQLGYTQRAEMGGDPMVRDQVRAVNRGSGGGF